MATIPVPRSFSQIVGDMLDALTSRFGIPSVKVGSPTLAIIEAAAQSDLRSSQDLFQLLDSTSLDRAEGLALDRIGADEDRPRIKETPSSGPVSISDTSFTKVATKIFQGLPAPIIGSTVIFVVAGTSLTGFVVGSNPGPGTSGSIYIGRGTTNYEGPLFYNRIDDFTSYVAINLVAGTNKFHNLGETVILAQGGNRTVGAGTLVQTPQGNINSSVQFATQFSAVVPDGETQITGVTVICQQNGVIGNIVASAISSFISSPFVGASVTNTVPFTNGLPEEDDPTFRESIRNVRASRAKGTALAIKTGVTGVTALDENKRVISASIITPQGLPATLFIDDGTGYEEKDIGIAFETLADQAVGGEQFFQLAASKPVAKAFTMTTNSAPFALVNGSKLAVRSGGIITKHTFTAAGQFRAIGNASAFEVVADVNADPTIGFNARTANGGTQVVLVSRTDVNEDVEVLAPGGTDIDANLILGFPAGRVDTLRLYKNDRLLFKDGFVATLNSNPQSLWGAMSSGETLILTVDGTALPGTVTFTDSDFINAGTVYSTLSNTNTIASWAAVINFKIPGVTASVQAGLLNIVSNLGANVRAAVNITGGTLVSKGMFNATLVLGLANDYSLDRNLGQLRLANNNILAVGDRLTAGSPNTRAFVQTSTLTTVNLVNPAELWFVVDGAAALVKTGINNSTAITVASVATMAWGQRIRVTATPAVFINAAAGNWAIFNDPNFVAANRGAWRIANVDPVGGFIEIERPTSWASPQASITLTQAGLFIVNTLAEVQKIVIPIGNNYTATTLATSINSQLVGGTAAVFRTNTLRVRTNTFATTGDVALVAQNLEAQKLTFTTGNSIPNLSSHLASAIAARREYGTTPFTVNSVTSSTGANNFTVSALGNIFSGAQEASRKNLPDDAINYTAQTVAFTVGGTLTGGTSGATATIAANNNSGTTGTLYLTGRSGTFIGGEIITGSITGSATSVAPGSYLAGRWGKSAFTSAIQSISGTTVNLRRSVIQGEWLPQDRLYPAAPFALNGQGILTTIVDGDAVSKRFVVNMFRRGKPATTVYGATVAIKDADNSNKSLAAAFGTSFDWTDFAVFMRGRTKSHGSPDNSKTGLWRYGRSGPEGNVARLAYNYPIAPSSPVSVVTDTFTDGNINLTIRLPSGPARTGTTIRNSTNVGVAFQTFTGGTGLYSVIYVLGFPISTASRTTNVTTLTLTLAGSITNHGLLTGNQIFVNSTNVNFSSGIFTITAVTATTVQYTETAADQVATPNIGTVSFDVGGQATLQGSTVVLNDIARANATTGLPAAFQLTVNIKALGNQFWSADTPTNSGVAVSTTLTWYPVTLASGLSFYPIDTGNNTIAQIVTTVNNLAAVANSTVPLTGVAVGDGTVNNGQIAFASYEASPNGNGNVAPNPWYQMSDSINYVLSTVNPPDTNTDYTFTFKDPVTASLATNSDWINEDVRLVPLTTLNIVNYLNNSAVGGLFASAEISASNQGSSPQIASLTLGSGGSVQVQGGSANTASSSVKGNAVGVASQFAVATVAAQDALGLSGKMWISVENSKAVPKDVIDANTTLTSIDALGNFVFNAAGTKAWTWANTGAAVVNAFTWQIEKQDAFVAYVWTQAGTAPALAGVQEGDWVIITGSYSNLNSRNTGTFRIIRIDDTAKIFWVDNPNVLEAISQVDLKFVKYNSIIPGDTLTINTPLWGTANIGSWIVASIDPTNQWAFAVSVAQKATTAQGAVAALGTSSSLVQVIEFAATRFIKQIVAITPNQIDGTLADVKFAAPSYFTKISANSGTVIRALDKLNFPTTIATGIDGYSHAIGLIGQVNKVAYGDPADPATYPGIIAVGASVNILGPLVKRIVVSLSIRVRTGVSTTDIINKVKSAVAAVINKQGIGQPVAISDIVTAAGQVNGVLAVTILSPIFASGSDLISAQPFEKTLVLNVDTDVLVSLVGT